MDRKTILQGCRDGFAACYDLFVGSAAAAVESPTEEEKSPDIGVQARWEQQDTHNSIVSCLPACASPRKQR